MSLGAVGRYSIWSVRVLYVNPFSQQVCGPDESLLALLTELVPRGVEAHVVLPAPGPHVERYRAVGATVHFAPVSVLSRGLGAGGALVYPFRLARGAAALFSLARRLRVDLIHSNMEVTLDGGLAALLLRLPHVMHYRGNTLDRPRRVFDVLVWLWTRLARRVFCISEATAEVFRKRGYREKVEVVYNPIDVAKLSDASRSATVRGELGAHVGDLLIGTVGRIHPRKDLATFLRAGAIVLGEFPSARLVVVGPAEAPAETAYLPQVQQLAQALGIQNRVFFAGTRRDIPAVMGALDIFVLCSRHEGFGRVVAEALAAGRPVVVTNEGALPELVANGRSGLLARAEQASEFATAISRIAREPALRQTLQSEARQAAARFDRAHVAAQVLAAYATVAGAGSRGAE